MVRCQWCMAPCDGPTYCSDSCRESRRQSRRKPPIIRRIKCRHCGKSTSAIDPKTRYCGKRCRIAHRYWKNVDRSRALGRKQQRDRKIRLGADFINAEARARRMRIKNSDPEAYAAMLKRSSTCAREWARANTDKLRAIRRRYGIKKRVERWAKECSTVVRCRYCGSEFCPLGFVGIKSQPVYCSRPCHRRDATIRQWIRKYGSITPELRTMLVLVDQFNRVTKALRAFS